MQHTLIQQQKKPPMRWPGPPRHSTKSCKYCYTRRESG